MKIRDLLCCDAVYHITTYRHKTEDYDLDTKADLRAVVSEDMDWIHLA
jgi:hypothetical protein